MIASRVRVRRSLVGLAVMVFALAGFEADGGGREAGAQPEAPPAVVTRTVNDGASTVTDLRARPARVARLGGARCPQPERSVTVEAVGPGVAAGPVVAALGFDAAGMLRVGNPQNGWRSAKVLWLVRADEPEPVLVRATRLDGPGEVRFGDGVSFHRSLVLKGDAVSTAPAQWRDIPSSFAVRRSGCYAFQIDGPGFQARMAFAMTPAASPGNDAQPDVYATQAAGPTVMIDRSSDGYYLTAERDDDRICIELRQTGAPTGPGFCAVPADPRWPTSLFAALETLNGRRYAIGVVAGNVVDVRLEGRASLPITTTTHLPFPTIRFFAEPVPGGGAVHLGAFGSDETLLSDVTLS